MNSEEAKNVINKFETVVKMGGYLSLKRGKDGPLSLEITDKKVGDTLSFKQIAELSNKTFYFIGYFDNTHRYEILNNTILIKKKYEKANPSEWFSKIFRYFFGNINKRYAENIIANEKNRMNVLVSSNLVFLIYAKDFKGAGTLNRSSLFHSLYLQDLVNASEKTEFDHQEKCDALLKRLDEELEKQFKENPGDAILQEKITDFRDIYNLYQTRVATIQEKEKSRASKKTEENDEASLGDRVTLSPQIKLLLGQRKYREAAIEAKKTFLTFLQKNSLLEDPTISTNFKDLSRIRRRAALKSHTDKVTSGKDLFLSLQAQRDNLISSLNYIVIHDPRSGVVKAQEEMGEQALIAKCQELYGM